MNCSKEPIRENESEQLNTKRAARRLCVCQMGKSAILTVKAGDVMNPA